MRVRYFPDTDTLLVNFSDGKIAETRDVTEDVLVEFDGQDRLVSMTIEHAKEQMDLMECTCQVVTT
jgi:uncharacterized protein YuzE